MTHLGVLCLVAAATTFGAAADQPIRIHGGAPRDGIGTYAIQELERYLGRMFTNPVVTDDGDGGWAIVVGTPDSNPRIREAIDAGTLALPEGKYADQGYAIQSSDGAVYIAGHTDVGALYGVYAFLEEHGAYFQITGERLPEPAAYAPKALNLVQQPVFKYRGLLPWDNFLCGMSGYNFEDYAELIDRATRMRMNKLQFHFYPGMAFFTETVDGETVNPKVIGMPVDTFRTAGAVGEHVFGDIEIFAPEPYVENRGNPPAQAEAVQAMMRDVLDYAQSRGFATVVGFELMNTTDNMGIKTDKPDGGLNFLDPLREENVELSLQRYRSLVETYPQSDYYWMWQPEARGYLSRQVGREPGAAEMRAEYAHWSGHLYHEGDIDYAYLFREVAKRLTPEERARLSTGGWSVQHIFPGIHPDFPEEIIFASLNPYIPSMTLADHMEPYRVAEDSRRAWMIDWWEFDGEQWFQQFRVTWQEDMYRQCKEWGVEGVTLLGWKLSALEHNVRYLTDFAWNPDTTAEAFYTDYVTRLYGPDAAPLAETYLAYDALCNDMPPANPFDDRRMLLAAGWMAMGIPQIPGTPEGLESDAWKHTVERAAAIAEEQRELHAMDAEAAEQFAALKEQLDAQGRSWAALMENRMRFRMVYLESLIALNEAFVEFDEVAANEDYEAAARRAAEKTQTSLDLAREAIEIYAEDVRNRGDLGVVAQMNEQFYNVIRRFLTSLAGYESPYVELDWEAFRIVPTVDFDMSGQPFTARDGAIAFDNGEREGRPTFKVTIGDGQTQYNSVFVHQGAIDLDESPYLDFSLRMDSSEPTAIMFQVDDDATYYALNLVGRQQLYSHLDGLPANALSDNQWRRGTWNIGRLVREQVDVEAQTIRGILLGAWETPSEPITVEFGHFTIGRHRTLD